MSESALRGGHLIILALGTFVLGTDAFVLNGLLPMVAGDLHVSEATAGQLATVFAISYAFGAPLIAAFTGPWDRRVVLAAGLGVFVAGIVLQATGPTFTVVTVGRLVAGLGAAGFQSTAYTVAGVLSTPRRRARALAIVLSGGSVAHIAGAPLGVLLGTQLGWRGAVWCIAALAAATGAFLFVLPKAVVPTLSLRARFAALGDPAVLAILAATVAALAPTFMFNSYIAVLLGPTAAASVIMLAIGAFGVGQGLTNAVVPRLTRTMGARGTVIAGCGMSTIGLLLASVGTPAAPAVIVAAALVGVASGLIITPQQGRFFLETPGQAPVAMGLNGSAVYVSSACGTAIGGLALHLGGPRSIGFIGALIAAAVALSLALRRLRHRRGVT